MSSAAEAGGEAAAAPPLAGALAALAAASFRRPWSEAQLAAELAAPGGRLWWEGEGSAPRAYLLAHRVLDELEIRSLAVAPAARRRGLARHLLARALADARREGVAQVHLEVAADDRGARALYAAAGFRAVGRRRGYYADGEDALLLRCELAGPGAAAG